MKFSFRLGLVLTLCCPSLLLAQDDVDVNGFFKKGSVTSTDSPKEAEDLSDQDSNSIPSTDSWTQGEEEEEPEQPEAELPKTELQPEQKKEVAEEPSSADEILQHTTAIIDQVKQNSNLASPEPKITTAPKIKTPPAEKKTEEKNLRNQVNQLLGEKKADDLANPAPSVEPTEAGAPLPAKLTLLVSASSDQHLKTTLKHLLDLKRVQNVQTSKIALFGAEAYYQRFVKAYDQVLHSAKTKEEAKNLSKKLGQIKQPEAFTILANNGFDDSDSEDEATLLKNYAVKYSPTWIIETKQGTWIFEGETAPGKFFNSHGEFVRADNPKHVTVKSAVEFSANEDQNATIFEPESKETPPSSANYPELPDCAAEHTRRVQVFQHSPESDGVDFVIYDPSAPGEQMQAQQWTGKSVAYQAGAKKTILPGPDDQLRGLALTAGVSCLPTRFHFVEEPGGRFIEYREGTLAWKNP